MDNVYLPKMQTYFKQILGFPVPFFPYGRFFLSLPRRSKLTICVGKPIFPTAQKDSPSLEEVDALHKQYFDELGSLFERNKESCGFPRHSIEWCE